MPDRKPLNDDRKRTPSGDIRGRCRKCRVMILRKVSDRRYNKGFRWECVNCDMA